MRAVQKPLYPLLLLLALALAWLAVESMQRSQRPPAAPDEERIAARTPETSGAAPGDESGTAAVASPTSAVREPLAAHAAEERGSGPGTLRVRVISASGAALAGVPVCLRSPGEAVVTSAPADLPARGGSDDVLRTDAEGAIEFTLPHGQLFTLLVNWERSFEAGAESVEVDALAPGERRELTVELATGLDGLWHGRILDGSSGAPLEGARVERVVGDPFRARTTERAARSAPDGGVELAFASWGERSVARVELDGYAPAFVTLAEGHASPADALAVRLWRPARLDVRVQDATGRPRAEVDVRVTCAAYDLFQGQPWFSLGVADPEWSSRTDADGRAALAELPAEVALTLELRAGERVLGVERALRLEAGEHRELVRVVGAGCTVTGRTLEADGSPAPNVQISLRPGTNPRFADEHEPLQTVRSDARGAFELADVAAGAWLVVPSSSRAEEIAPVAVPLVIAPDQTTATLDVTCWRGLYLTGTVVGPDGEAVEQAHVQALAPQFIADESMRDGTFTLGPLPQGTFQLTADTFFGPFSASEPLTAEAGASGLVLRLRHAASLRVRVLDADGGRAADVMVWVLHETDARASKGVMTDAAGEVELAAVLPGSCTLSAADASGAFSVLHDVALVAGVDPAPLELRLEPAARVRLRLPEPLAAGVGIEILRAGRPIALAIPNASPLVSVPPGELEVRLVHWLHGSREVLRTERVVARLGEEVAVDLGAP